MRDVRHILFQKLYYQINSFLSLTMLNNKREFCYNHVQAYSVEHKRSFLLCQSCQILRASYLNFDKKLAQWLIIETLLSEFIVS